MNTAVRHRQPRGLGGLAMVWRRPLLLLSSVFFFIRDSERRGCVVTREREGCEARRGGGVGGVVLRLR